MDPSFKMTTHLKALASTTVATMDLTVITPTLGTVAKLIPFTRRRVTSDRSIVLILHCNSPICGKISLAQVGAGSGSTALSGANALRIDQRGALGREQISCSVQHQIDYLE
jgi:hypothetical protein